jgi:hypothetical protein
MPSGSFSRTRTPQRSRSDNAKLANCKSARFKKYSADSVASGVSCSSCAVRNSQRVLVCAGGEATSGVSRGTRGPFSRLGSLRTGSICATTIEGTGASRLG